MPGRKWSAVSGGDPRGRAAKGPGSTGEDRRLGGAGRLPVRVRTQTGPKRPTAGICGEPWWGRTFPNGQLLKTTDFLD